MNEEQFKKIIKKAVGQEIEAYLYYSKVSEKTKDAGLKKLFKDLAREEDKHRHTLGKYLEKAPGKMHFSEAADYKVVDALPTPKLSPRLKPADGLLIAIKKELEAMQMYTQLAAASTDEAQKNVFLSLASMERGHKSRLEDIYTTVAFPEVW